MQTYLQDVLHRGDSLIPLGQTGTQGIQAAIKPCLSSDPNVHQPLQLTYQLTNQEEVLFGGGFPMKKTFTKPLIPILSVLVSFPMWLWTPQMATAEEMLSFRIDTRPFSTAMCKKIHPLDDIRIRVAHHRDLVVRPVAGQHVPPVTDQARTKSYVHAVPLSDLTNSVIGTGTIAFTSEYAIIFTKEYPVGLSRDTFITQLPKEQQDLANRALNTFLRLHKVFNAAIDACRPYPSKVTYGTDDDINKIEAGRLTYRQLAQEFNRNPNPNTDLIRHERGLSGGFVDPTQNRKGVSYHAINPLYFYRS